jgi:hypothetical protein
MAMPKQSLRERFQALNETSSRHASQLAAEKTKVRIWGIVVSPGLTFLRVYFWQGAWRRGLAGFHDALFAAYEVFVGTVKVWELQQDHKSS